MKVSTSLGIAVCIRDSLRRSFFIKKERMSEKGVQSLVYSLINKTDIVILSIENISRSATEQ